MPYLNTTLTRSAITKTTRKTKQQIKQRTKISRQSSISKIKSIGICYYTMMLKEEKKKQIYHSHNFYENAFCSTNKTSVTASVDMLVFEKQGIGCDLSMVRKSYKLTKSTTKTEKFEKVLKTV